MIESKKIQVQRTAHYATLGNIGPQTKYLWIVCHGYGQLSKHFIKRFDVLDREDTFVLAPEGLSRFYWQGVGLKQRKVVSSWMTSEDRLDEIADYCNMLSTLYQYYVSQASQEVKVILLGFSQGCATQIRWIHKEHPSFDTLVLWGGLFPEDLDYSPLQGYWTDIPKYFVYGNQDEYLTEKVHQLHHELLKQHHLKVIEKKFEGKHVIDRPTLAELAKEVYSNL